MILIFIKSGRVQNHWKVYRVNNYMDWIVNMLFSEKDDISKSNPNPKEEFELIKDCKQNYALEWRLPEIISGRGIIVRRQKFNLKSNKFTDYRNPDYQIPGLSETI